MPASSFAATLPRTLLVAPSPDVAERLTDWLKAAGHETVMVVDFRSARDELNTYDPDLLVTEVRLGPFNGLHLAIVALTQCAIPTILIGQPDSVLEEEARRQSALYVTRPMTRDTFWKALERALEPRAPNGSDDLPLAAATLASKAASRVN